MSSMNSCFHLSRQFTNLKDQLIELHVQRHFNYIQIKVVKCNSFAKSVFIVPLLILLVVTYWLQINLEDISIWISLSISGSIALFSYFLFCHYIITEESILIIRTTHGVQYNYRNLLGKVTSEFIASTNIIINESITMSKVISYLSVLECQSTDLTSSQQIHPIFVHLAPRLDCLKFIYSHITDFLENKTQQIS